MVNINQGGNFIIRRNMMPGHFGSSTGHLSNIRNVFQLILPLGSEVSSVETLCCLFQQFRFCSAVGSFFFYFLTKMLLVFRSIFSDYANPVQVQLFCFVNIQLVFFIDIFPPVDRFGSISAITSMPSFICYVVLLRPLVFVPVFEQIQVYFQANFKFTLLRFELLPE